MSIHISRETADAISRLGLGVFFAWVEPERMAWAVLILRELEDRPAWFPKGKWATIQAIEAQLVEQAKEHAQVIENR